MKPHLSSKLLRAEPPGSLGLRSGEEIVDSKLLGPCDEVLLVDLGPADSKHLDDIAPLLGRYLAAFAVPEQLPENGIFWRLDEQLLSAGSDPDLLPSVELDLIVSTRPKSEDVDLRHHRKVK